MKKKPTYDEYIANCEEFAQPILRYLRTLIHSVCPDVHEEIKWNFPYFTYKRLNIMYMAGFKEHATLGFGLAKEMSDARQVFVKEENAGMGNFGKLRSIEDLPSEEILLEYIREAMILHDQGVKPIVKKAPIKPKMEIPPGFQKALKNNRSTKKLFETFSTYQQNEYIEWIVDAKTETTANKRITQALEWISEGKPRNWKYMKSWKGKK